MRKHCIAQSTQNKIFIILTQFDTNFHWRVKNYYSSHDNLSKWWHYKTPKMEMVTRSTEYVTEPQMSSIDPFIPTRPISKNDLLKITPIMRRLWFSTRFYFPPNSVSSKQSLSFLKSFTIENLAFCCRLYPTKALCFSRI